MERDQQERMVANVESKTVLTKLTFYLNMMRLVFNKDKIVSSKDDQNIVEKYTRKIYGNVYWMQGTYP